MLRLREEVSAEHANGVAELHCLLVKDTRLKHAREKISSLLDGLRGSLCSEILLSSTSDAQRLLEASISIDAQSNSDYDVELIKQLEKRCSWMEDEVRVQEVAGAVEKLVPNEDAEVLTHPPGFSEVTINTTPTGELHIYWAHCRSGTFGVYQPHSRKLEVLVDNLLRPTRVEAKDHCVYILEEGHSGASEGRLSMFSTINKQWMVMLEHLSQPTGLFVTHSHTVVFIERCAGAASGSKPVDWKVSGFQAFRAEQLGRRKITLLEQQHSPSADSDVSSRASCPDDLAISADGKLYLAYSRISTGNGDLVGGVAVCSPHARYDAFNMSGEWQYQSSSIESLYCGLSPIKSISMTPGGRILLAGCGSSSLCPDRPTALATAAKPGESLRVLCEGFAVSATIDNDGNVFYCSGQGEGQLLAMWAPDPQTQGAAF